jgi:hypothetical protein
MAYVNGTVIVKYAVEMDSSDMIYILSFIQIGSGVKKLLVGTI